MCVGTGEHIMGENKKSEDSSHFCCFIVFFFTKTSVLVKETKAHVVVRLFRLFLLLLFLLLFLGCKGKQVKVWLTKPKDGGCIN